MDGLEIAAIEQAYSSLAMVRDTRQSDERASIRAAIKMAFVQQKARNEDAAITILKNSPDPIIAKAAAQSFTSVWQGPDAQALLAGIITAAAQQSALDWLKRLGGRTIPSQLANMMVASGFSADTTTEGAPKVCGQLPLHLSDVEKHKSTALIVLSQDLLAALGDAGLQLFERELISAIVRATNEGIASLLNTTSSDHVASTGDPLSDLRAGLRASTASDGYVVLAGTGEAADLATRIENKGGMTVRGGEFCPGVAVIAVDSLSGLTIIPASNVAIFDDGLRMQSAGHASVDMRASPTAPYQLVSLWQTGCTGLLAERSFHIATDSHLVTVA